MILLIKLAWRNIFRNKRKTLLSCLAIGIGLASLILADAFIIGMEENMIRMATDTLLGQGQIHKEGFRDTLDVEKTIVQNDSIIIDLEKEKDIKAFSPRTIVYAMLTSPANVESILLYGIESERERYISRIDKYIIKGSLESINDDRKVIIGSSLANNLEIDIGDRVVITLAQANTGDLSQEMFRLGGIFEFGIREIDMGTAFISLPRAQEMLGINDSIHEIAFHFNDIALSRDRSLTFWKRFSKNGNVAEGWMDLMSELEALLELSQFSVYITAFILFGVVSLGIMNTLFMSLYERMFEFGVLRAVGTRPTRMALIIIFEAGALALLSIIIGMLLGYLSTYTLSVIGIDYTGLEFGGLTFREKLYPVINLSQYLIYPLWLFIFTLIIGIYPGVYAAKISPAKAMRKSF